MINFSYKIMFLWNDQLELIFFFKSFFLIVSPFCFVLSLKSQCLGFSDFHEVLVGGDDNLCRCIVFVSTHLLIVLKLFNLYLIHLLIVLEIFNLIIPIE